MKRIDEILVFWFGPAGPQGPVPRAHMARWWEKDPAFDEEIRLRFSDVMELAAWGDLDAWRETPEGVLALLLLLDQFPRNVHRGTPGAFAQDAKALQIAREAVAQGVDRQLPPLGRVFVYLPFEHAEDLAAQEEACRLFDALHAEAPEDLREACATFADYARRHHAVVERFGRFPHRNAILGRETSAEEAEFLLQPGSAF